MPQPGVATIQERRTYQRLLREIPQNMTDGVVRAAARLQASLEKRRR